MSERQGIERPAVPPYARGDRIYDRANPGGASYEVMDCFQLGPVLAAAAHASWQVTFMLAGGRTHRVFVDDTGNTPAQIFGPKPPGVDLEQLLAAYTYVRPGGR